MAHHHISNAGLVDAETFEDRGHTFVRVRMIDRNNGETVDLVFVQPAFAAFADRLTAIAGEIVVRVSATDV
jgi:hypothetical protein